MCVFVLCTVHISIDWVKWMYEWWLKRTTDRERREQNERQEERKRDIVFYYVHTTDVVAVRMFIVCMWTQTTVIFVVAIHLLFKCNVFCCALLFSVANARELLSTSNTWNSLPIAQCCYNKTHLVVRHHREFTRSSHFAQLNFKF